MKEEAEGRNCGTPSSRKTATSPERAAEAGTRPARPGEREGVTPATATAGLGGGRRRREGGRRRGEKPLGERG